MMETMLAFHRENANNPRLHKTKQSFKIQLPVPVSQFPLPVVSARRALMGAKNHRKFIIKGAGINE